MPDLPPPRRRAVFACALLVVAATFALHAPSIAAPFGTWEINSGLYFGPFAVNYRVHGLAALRGVPVFKAEFESLNRAFLYLNHPPAAMWTPLLFGTAEWCIRLPFVLAGAASGVLLLLLLRSTLGPAGATVAGVFYATCPAVAFAGVASYEPFVSLFGLLFFLCTTRVADSGAGRSALLWRLGQCAAAFVGVWFDWSFAFWLLAAVVLVRRPVRELVAPAVCAVASLGLLLWWQRWALEAPDLPRRDVDLKSIGLWSVFERRLPLAMYLRESAERLRDAFTWPTLAASALGVLRFAKIAPRLAAALLLPFLVNVTVFDRHAIAHVQFFGWLGLTLGAGLGALIAWRGRARALARAVVLVGVAFSVHESIDIWRRTATPFFRDLGYELDHLSAVVDERYVPSRLWNVRYNLPYAYVYYTRSPMSRPEADLQTLKAELASTPADLGFRYLRFKFRGAAPADAPPTELDRWLESFPSRRLPVLEKTVSEGRYGGVFEVLEARAFDLKEAKLLPQR
jgi:hypothetical protein